MFGRVLLDTGDVLVTLSFLGRLKIAIAGGAAYVATRKEKAYFFAAADAFAEAGKLNPNDSECSGFIEEFAFAVADRGGVTWQAFFLESSPDSWAKLRSDTDSSPESGEDPSFEEYQNEVYKDVTKELDSDDHTTNGLPMYLDLEIESFVTANCLFKTFLPWDKRPEICFLKERGFFGSVQYEIARQGTPGRRW